MQLQALPVEIISRICRFIGLEFENIPGQKRTVSYRLKDFQSLRITCKELYQKTSYDAAVRYSYFLEELEIHLEQSSIVQFLQISKNPAFRDRIYTLNIYTPELYDSADLDTSTMDAERSEVEDTAEKFIASNEAVHLLAECFRHLKSARNLQRIELCSDYGHDLVLRALSLACFPRQLASFSIEPNQMSKLGYGILSSDPQACAPYIEGLKIQPLLCGENHSSYKLSDEEREENPLGLHLQNYRPTTTEFTDLVSTFVNLGSIDFSGCRSHAELRLCHGCDDMFAKNFASAIYPNLSSFTVTSTFISGGRLRRFIKGHAGTLANIDMSFTSLTDGSWRSIAQGLAKLPHLRMLRLESLRQKGRATKTTRPPQYTNLHTVYLVDASHIQHFLKIFVTFFATVQCLSQYRLGRYPPIYHEAKLFELPDLGVPSGEVSQSRAGAVLRRYAEVDGAC